MNVDADHLSVYVRAGMPKLHHGRYGLISCLAWAVRHQQDALRRRGFRIGDVTERDVKIRALKATAELKELELARSRRELIPAYAVQERWLDIVSVVKARLLAIPARVTPMIVAEADRSKIQRIVDAEIRSALLALAGSGIPENGKPSSHPESASASAD